MSDDAAVVWLDEGAARDDAVRALEGWARTRGVRLVPVQEGASALVVDPSIGDRVEQDLERAREALAAADATETERALARAEQLLREHPELPQAAWLRAEVERTWSARWQRIEPRDEARARSAWQHAEALDRGRVPGIGEASAAPEAEVEATLVFTGATPSRLSVWLDGVLLTDPRTDAGHQVTFRKDVAPGEHHLFATLGDRVVFASWVAVGGPEQAPILVTIGDGNACTSDQFSEVRRTKDRIEANGVVCPRWVAAMSTDKPDAVLVARCAQAACGPLLEWRIERFESRSKPVREERARWPAWATFTLLGIGAATATTMALIATGVFEARPVEPRFVIGGARQQ